RRGDRLDHLVDLIGRAGDLQLDLGQKAHGIFGAAIDFGVALLTPVAFHLGDGQSLNADLGEGIADLVELERLDDGHDDFHRCSLRSSVRSLSRTDIPYSAGATRDPVPFGPTAHSESNTMPVAEAAPNPFETRSVFALREHCAGHPARPALKSRP